MLRHPAFAGRVRAVVSSNGSSGIDLTDDSYLDDVSDDAVGAS